MASLSLDYTKSAATQATSSPVWKSILCNDDGRLSEVWYAAGDTWAQHQNMAKTLNVPEAERHQLYPHSTKRSAEKAWLKLHSPFSALPAVCEAFTTAPRGCKYTGKLWRPALAVKVTPTHIEVALAGQKATRRIPFADVRSLAQPAPKEMAIA